MLFLFISSESLPTGKAGISCEFDGKKNGKIYKNTLK